MKGYKTLTAITKESNYEKVVSYINLYNERTKEDVSVSKFVWNALKFYINYLRNNKGIK